MSWDNRIIKSNVTSRLVRLTQFV